MLCVFVSHWCLKHTTEGNMGVQQGKLGDENIGHQDQSALQNYTGGCSIAHTLSPPIYTENRRLKKKNFSSSLLQSNLCAFPHSFPELRL